MAEIWGINIYFVWNITIAPLSVCRDFLVIMCICVTNHVPFLLTVRYFVKNAYIMQFFLKMAERWGINIYVAWNTTIVPLSLCRTFFIYNPYLRDKSRSLDDFFDHWTIFCKNDHKLFLSQNGGRLGYKYLFHMKDHYSPLEYVELY